MLGFQLGAKFLTYNFCVDLEVVFDYYTGIVSTEGLQISSLSAKPLPLDKRPVSFNSIEFVPLINAVNKVKSFRLARTSCTVRVVL